jgi:hypothetical protein
MQTRQAATDNGKCSHDIRKSNTLSPNGGTAVTCNYIARLNSDSALDLTFNPNPDVGVNSIGLQADGKIWAVNQKTK